MEIAVRVPTCERGDDPKQWHTRKLSDYLRLIPVNEWLRNREINSIGKSAIYYGCKVFSTQLEKAAWKQQVKDLVMALKTVPTGDFIFIYYMTNPWCAKTRCSYQDFWNDKHPTIRMVEMRLSWFLKLVIKLNKEKKSKIAPEE